MKTDARVRYTRMRIREAFYACLAEKPVNKITVKELCERAEINRATFYTHYTDPFDLLEKLEEETLESMRGFIARSRQSGTGVLLAMLRGMEDDSRALLASSNGDPGFASKMSALFYEEYFSGILERLSDQTEEERAMAYLFIAGGCGSVISTWLNGGRQTAAEELAARIGVLCDAFLAAMRDTKRSG